MAEGAESDAPLRGPSRILAIGPRPMSIQVFQHVKDAIRNLDPEDIRRHTERPLRLVALRR